MKAQHAVVAALAVGMTLAAVASAGTAAAKQRVSITATVLPTAKAVLGPLQEGKLARNVGSFNGIWSPTPERTVIRDGQEIDIHPATWTFAGKGGTLVFREHSEWTDLGQDLNRDGSEDGIGTGTWKVVRGTGAFAGITGGGRSSHLGQGHRWVARYEGFLTLP